MKIITDDKAPTKTINYMQITKSTFLYDLRKAIINQSAVEEVVA